MGPSVAKTDFLIESHLKTLKDYDDALLIVSPGFRVKRKNQLFAIFIGKKKKKKQAEEKDGKNRSKRNINIFLKINTE